MSHRQLGADEVIQEGDRFESLVDGALLEVDDRFFGLTVKQFHSDVSVSFPVLRTTEEDATTDD